MFTGLVTDVGTIQRVAPGDTLKRVRIRSKYPAAGIALGVSIACGGPCLTAVAVEPEGDGCVFDVDVGAETLARTTAGAWREGMRVNLERSLKIGDELGGHIVTGHVDGVATIVETKAFDGMTRFDIDGLAEILSIDAFDGMSRFAMRVPAKLARFIAEKGSVCLDGTSLTVNGVEGDTFTVLLIPHTLAVTTWGERRVGDCLNLEVDLMARYAARLVETAAAA